MLPKGRPSHLSSEHSGTSLLSVLWGHRVRAERRDIQEAIDRLWVTKGVRSRRFWPAQAPAHSHRGGSLCPGLSWVTQLTCQNSPTSQNFWNISILHLTAIKSYFPHTGFPNSLVAVTIQIQKLLTSFSPLKFLFNFSDLNFFTCKMGTSNCLLH